MIRTAAAPQEPHLRALRRVPATFPDRPELQRVIDAVNASDFPAAAAAYLALTPADGILVAADIGAMDGRCVWALHDAVKVAQEKK